MSELCVGVEAARHRHTFRVVVVGEFNRGKSTIVNQLLGLPVMQTGPLALTDGLVFSRGSSSPRIEVESAGGHRSRLPLSPDSWLASGVGDRVTVWVDSFWLGSSGVELIDTAGTNTTAAAGRAANEIHIALQAALKRAPQHGTEESVGGMN